jgi:glycosyltransferase involved in cell wall biosynthesis
MSKTEPLVSVIVPCYNMGNRIHRLLDSMCEQNYGNIELIIIDDGSIDNSKEVIDSYRQKLEEKGIVLYYIYQSNSGLGGAIDTGLKHIKGEYFCWPDADDYLTATSIKERVDFLENNKDYGLVRSDAYLYYENDLYKPVGYISRKHKDRFKEENLFADYILEKNIIFCPGCHLVRTSAFRDVNPIMSIFPGKRGQNYQLLLPLIHKYKFGYIDKPLYHYIIYENSMSRGDTDYQKIEFRYDELQTIIIETLKRMNLSEREYDFYANMTYEKYHILKIKAAVSFGEKAKFYQHYNAINRSKPLSIVLLNMLIRIPFFGDMMTMQRKIKNKAKNNRVIRIIYNKLTTQ